MILGRGTRGPEPGVLKLTQILYQAPPAPFRFLPPDSRRGRMGIVVAVISLHALIILAGWLILPHAAPLPFDPDKVIEVVEVIEPPPTPSPEPIPSPEPSPPPAPLAQEPPPPTDAPPPAAAPPTLNEPVATDITANDLRLAASDQPQGPVGPVDPHASPNPNGPVGTGNPTPAEIEYQPQYTLTGLPRIPDAEFRRRIVYPALAAKQGIEATVILMIWVDQTGKIRKIQVQKDPGFGFAEAALAALDGLMISPGEIKGQPVAAAFRQVIPFKLK